MSLRLKKILILGACLLLAACGFHPMYGSSSGEANSAVRGNIAIDPLKGREGQIFIIALEDKFNPESINTADAPYRLHLSLTKVEIPSVVKSDSTIQRYSVRFITQFQLFKTGSLKPVYTGSLMRSGSYNAAINANFATYEAEQDVIDRTLQELAEDYVLRISTYLAGQPAGGPVLPPAETQPAVQHNQ